VKYLENVEFRAAY